MAILARTVLWYIVFAGFAVNYMVRININIAMVSMVNWTYLRNQNKTAQCEKVDVEINSTVSKEAPATSPLSSSRNQLAQIILSDASLETSDV